jgi:CBS domain-containing protein
MNIASLCRRDLVSIDAAATLDRAAALMRDEHVGALVVTEAVDGHAPRVRGVVTDRDIVIEVVAAGINANTVRVGDLPRETLIDVPASASLGEAAAAMQRGGVRRVLVTEDDGQVVGLVSSDDLVAAISGELDALSRALRAGFVREAAQRGRLENAARPRLVSLPRFGEALTRSEIE